ncbi:TIGR03667 family PPOX class F420-dependent oxidoreductase [Rubrobacter calidifluminis]|uniref:TIGR03667 family PPOX class F420-dependent oxidoreductase n=1 Tax=Rubrobacter calidifluminis TaxID=1392640 RepID=UPI00235DD85D|nr:TIGR03667 family PPOX class F420-dependent oxidoreductase [Rubrobacter calidifluminis]
MSGPDRRGEERLRTEEVIWLTTVRRDGQPQPVPVCFLWDGETFLIYSQPDRQKLRNIARNPRVALNLNSDAHGGGVVRIEGGAGILEGFPPATEVPEYLEKHREPISRIGYDPEGFAREYSTAVHVTPDRWQSW